MRRGALSYQNTCQTGESFGTLTNPEQPQSVSKVGSLSKNEGDGYENGAQKVNSRYFKLYRAYSNSFNSPNVGNLFFSAGVEF